MSPARTLSFALALVGCEAPPTPATTPVTRAATASAPESTPKPSERPNAPAPAGAPLTDAQRSDAVLALFAGEVDLATLPLHDVDAGAQFEPELRDRIAPRAQSGRVPRIRQETATVTGDLDKDIIRRIVRAHINEIRYCYNQVLVLDPTAAGRVEIDFEIAGDGTVSSSTVKRSTVHDETMPKCMTKAVLRWTFPKPDDGKRVTVAYPFVFEAG